jgi:hypothetical protein
VIGPDRRLWLLKRVGSARATAAGMLRVAPAPRGRARARRAGRDRRAWLVLGVAPGRVSALPDAARSLRHLAAQPAGKDFGAMKPDAPRRRCD